MSFKINPSILSADFAHLGTEVKSVIQAGADNIHFDVMDNHYVPNLTLGPMFLKALRDDGIESDIDIHLMVKPVNSMIESFANAGATRIFFHPDASKDVNESLVLIKSFGIYAGIALNPSTCITVYEQFLDKIDQVLIMTVNPGFGGQKFINSMYSKIKFISRWLKKHKSEASIEVDGGVKLTNISKIAKCGAKSFVIGSAIFNSEDYKKEIYNLRNQLQLTT